MTLYNSELDVLNSPQQDGVGVVAAESERTSSALVKMLDRVRHAIGLDEAIAFTVLGRGWTSAAGLVTIFLITRFLTSAEQGYYYTFASLVALQMVFELGFSFVILQLASHERAHLTISPALVITGDPVAHARLASVFQKAVRWYSAVAIVMFAALIAVGFWFFTSHQHPMEHVAWQFPWCCAALAAAINFQIDPVLSFLEGCGFVSNVARVRLAQGITGSLFAWTALASHHGLFAPSLVMIGIAISSLVWLFGKRRLIFGLLRYPTETNHIRWRVEVWPFQWRIAVSWMCGYFIYQIFNPILFALKGPVEAGRMGMSLNVAGALTGVAYSWINTKAAPFGAMVARKEYGQLDRIFFRTVKQSTAVSIVGALVIWAGVFCLDHARIALAQRLLPPKSLAFLLAATVVNVLVFAEALYLRAHKQEKLLLQSVLTAVFTTTTAYFFGRLYGAQGIVVSYLLVVTIVSFGTATFLFLKYRRIWHAE